MPINSFDVPDKFEHLDGTTMSICTGGVEYFGFVVKVFYNPAIEEFQAKCAFYNEPTSYFFKTLER